MDILDILLDILLKPPQPLMGLFFEFHPYKVCKNQSQWSVNPRKLM